jgi:hypothetical protein
MDRSRVDTGMGGLTTLRGGDIVPNPDAREILTEEKGIFSVLGDMFTGRTRDIGARAEDLSQGGYFTREQVEAGDNPVMKDMYYSTYGEEGGETNIPSRTFFEVLSEDFDYPKTLPLKRPDGTFVADDEGDPMSVFPFPFDREVDESLRMARPEGREDLPTTQELADARQHMLASAMAAQEYGPETVGPFTQLREFTDVVTGGSNLRDMRMDQRNNAVGISLFKKAGINAPPRELIRLVDQAIFNQLERIMDRPVDKRGFISPVGGPDVYFPRDEKGFFDTGGFLSRAKRNK